MRQKKTLVLAEDNTFKEAVGDKRMYRVKSLVNSIKYSVGQRLGAQDVDRLISCPSWTVKIVAAVVEP